MKKIKNKRKLVFLVAGIGLLALSILCAGIYISNMTDNMFMAIPFLLCLAGGGYLVYSSIRGFDTLSVMAPDNPVAAEKPLAQVNSLNIYVDIKEKTPVKVAFEDVEKPMGYPHQCLNDGRWYYIHYKNMNTDGLVPFTLPDQQYYDPGEFSNVIKMKAHRDLFERRQGWFQKLAPWALVVGIVAVGIFMVIVTDL